MCECQPNPAIPVEFLRGLAARCRWAIAQGADDADSMVGEAQAEAYCQGRGDFENGRAASDIPPLLADVHALSLAWTAGWMEAGDVQEMARCRFCQDADTEVCFIHG